MLNGIYLYMSPTFQSDQNLQSYQSTVAQPTLARHLQIQHL